MPAPAARWKVWTAFGVIYILWGSAYLAMHIGMETVPPLLLAGSRLVVAGMLMTAWAWSCGHRLKPVHWRTTLIAGVLFFLFGHGCLYWGQPRLSSGLAAVLFATIPIWVVIIEALTPPRIRLNGRTAIGLLLGTAGVFMLVGPAHVLGSGRVDLLGAAVVVIGSLSWAIGSIYCSRAVLPAAPLAAGLEMLFGGALLVAVCPAFGEIRRFHVAAVSARSVGAWAYLIFLSSIIGFSCYLWLLRTVGPSRISTYAYVNPVVAVILGWAFAGEEISSRTLWAVAALLIAVLLIVQSQAEVTNPIPEAA